ASDRDGSRLPVSFLFLGVRIYLRCDDRQTGARPRLTLELRRLRWQVLARRNICLGGVLAELQSSDVGHDVPAIARWNLRRVVGHDAETVAHDVEEVSKRSLLQALLMKRWRLARESTRRDEAIAVSHARMAGRAINVIAPTPAFENLPRNRKR